MRTENYMGILAAALLLAGIAVRPDVDPTAQDALWSVGAGRSADAPAGKGLPSDLVPDELMLARWAVSARTVPDADVTAQLAERDTAPVRHGPPSDALVATGEAVASVDVLETR